MAGNKKPLGNKPSGKKPSGLGRGLSALMNDDMPSVAGREVTSTPRTDRKLPIGQIIRNKNQPRHIFEKEALVELSQSIREKGILQPILVRPLGKNRYEIVAGERRWRAAQLAGVHEIPVVVRELSDSEALEIGVIENVQRRDLTPIEEATSYRRLMDEFGHTQDGVSKVVGKSRSHVANLLRLLRLPATVQKLVDSGKLTMGHARALVGSVDALALAKKIISGELSVRQTEALLAKSKETTPKRSGGGRTRRKDTDTIALEKDLMAALGGMVVSIDHKGNGGFLQIKYRDLDELDGLCSKLGICGL